MNSEDESQAHLTGGTSGWVLLIDVSPAMWKEVEDERPIDILFSACTNLFKKMMINSPKQLIGISLFGTVGDDNQGIKNVIQLLPLKEPSVEDVRCLKDYVTDADKITRKWGVTEHFSLADALQQASRMFSGCRKKMSGQTITVLSALQPPSPTSHKLILKKASDIRELNITVNIVNVSPNAISADSFFMELGKVISDPPNMDWEPPEPVLDASDILTLIWSNNHSKRASANLKMYLGPDVVLGVGMYSLSTEQKPPRKQLLRDNEVVVSSSSWKTVPRYGQQDGEDNEDEFSWETLKTNPQSVPILKADLKYVAEFAERSVTITSQERGELNDFAGPPCIKLLGFKPSSVLNMSEWYLKPSSFIYPNDSLVEGSSQLFLALRDRCLALDRVAICVLLSRRFSLVRFVALVPQKRVVKGNWQEHPDGFHVIYLPYSDNVEELPLEVGTDSTVEQLTCMENILNTLNFEFDMFENPKLQTMYRTIEALALGEVNPEEIDDETLPDDDEQNNRLGSLPEDFQSLFGSMNISAVKRSQNSSKSNKRVAAGGPEDGKMIDSAMLVAINQSMNISAVKRSQNSSKSNKRVAAGGPEDGKMINSAKLVAINQSKNISAVKKSQNSKCNKKSNNSKSNKRVAAGGPEDGKMIDSAKLVARINQSIVDKYTKRQLKLIMKTFNVPNLLALKRMKKEQLIRSVYDNSSIILARAANTK